MKKKEKKKPLPRLPETKIVGRMMKITGGSGMIFSAGLSIYAGFYIKSPVIVIVFSSLIFLASLIVFLLGFFISLF